MQTRLSDRKQISGCLGLRLGLGKNGLQRGTKEIWGVMKNVLHSDVHEKTWNCLLNIGIIICKLYSSVFNMKKVVGKENRTLTGIMLYSFMPFGCLAMSIVTFIIEHFLWKEWGQGRKESLKHCLDKES